MNNVGTITNTVDSSYVLRYISMENNGFDIIPNDIWNTSRLWGLYLSNNVLINSGNDRFDSFVDSSIFGNTTYFYYMFTILDISNNQFQFIPDTFRYQAEDYLNGIMFPAMGDVILNISGNQMYCDGSIPSWLDTWNSNSDIDVIGYPGDQNCSDI